MRALHYQLPVWLSFGLIAITVVSLVYASTLQLLVTIRGVGVVSYTDSVRITEFSVHNTTHVKVSVEWLENADAPDCTVCLTQGDRVASASLAYGWQPNATVYVPFVLEEGMIVIQVTSP